MRQGFVAQAKALGSERTVIAVRQAHRPERSRGVFVNRAREWNKDVIVLVNRVREKEPDRVNLRFEPRGIK